ncbi:MAG: hypothetical protein WD407_08450 [Rhodospirillales bacterium]
MAGLLAWIVTLDHDHLGIGAGKRNLGSARAGTGGRFRQFDRAFRPPML